MRPLAAVKESPNIMIDTPLSDETTDREAPTAPAEAGEDTLAAARAKASVPAVETGGPKGPEPTRYGDWERKGRCIDF